MKVDIDETGQELLGTEHVLFLVLDFELGRLRTNELGNVEVEHGNEVIDDLVSEERRLDILGQVAELTKNAVLEGGTTTAKIKVTIKTVSLAKCMYDVTMRSAVARFFSTSRRSFKGIASQASLFFICS